MFKSLYTRIAVYTIVVMLFSAAVSFLCTNIIYHNFLKENNDAKIMRTLKDSMEYQNESKIDSYPPFFKHLGEMNYQIMTISENGKRTYYGEPFRKDNIAQQEVQSVLNGKDYHGIKNLPYAPIITGFFENTTQNTVGIAFESKGQNYAVFMRPDIGKTFSEFRIFLAILISLLLIISIILVISSTYTLIKPIQQLKNATERLMQGNFDTAIKITRKDELGTLQYRFDKMRLSLKQLDDMRQHFVQNVSHEIKTPLTHIHHLLDQLKFAKSDQERERYIDDIYQITTQLSELTKELLLLSEIDNGAHLEFKDHIELNQLLKQIIRHEQFPANEKDLIIMSDLENIEMIGNERLLHQAFQNLITNAIKYSIQGGTIDIMLKQDLDSINCTITDDGQGMTEETQSRLFERFYKASNHDNSNGLGLAIAKAIFELHGGTISIVSEKNKGTTFSIEIRKS
ncbi:MAG: HAMP domain-containing histidine kinase [Staphylococcus equorum]|uniref:HAMP domain-containing sensor histidine kinase n=1 Tax=Staphylococcus TaxID=1279 RepID=UPI000852D3DE|nr:HAMP domain-containing sensor histidine kinase [Staphylococcus equorum]MDG0823004.1 HAMP domain-containing histidine kinase [Staphylococcus equorum]MDG0836494.1 HAMP domain-containing histidine kinase [Staphylococcus equorum]MDK9872376.1 HAMP domain-containing sensor histidine kinase [Staphylococcus equorum]MDK9878135.1 HAMP domain-containing sensor histidine kinase [Staphylococcus equorum]MDN5809031.1 HAMP domain-containing histidine kinase [Staphylococcus equorum]